MADCCVGAPVYHTGPPSSFLSDPCVCNADIGTVYVNLTNRDIWIRTASSVVCSGADWTNVSTGGSGGTANTISVNLAAFPVSCNGIVTSANVEGALINLACAIRTPPLSIMAFTPTGLTCTPTVTIPSNLQGLLNLLICRDETILSKQLPWRINGQSTATVNSGATISDWITHFGNVTIGLAQGVLANAKLEVNGSIVTGNVVAQVMNSVSNNAILGGSSDTINSGTSNSVILGGTSNQITGANSVVMGAGNVMNGGTANFVAGGFNDILSGEACSILSGESNLIERETAVPPLIIANAIVTGTANIVRNNCNNVAIVAGNENIIFNSTNAMVGSGYANTVVNGSLNAAVLTGRINIVAGHESAIISGESNSISNTTTAASAILTGFTNALERGINAAIVGGSNNKVGLSGTTTSNSVVVGGNTNIVSAGANNSFIGGGDSNTTSATGAAILTGNGGIITGQHGVIVSGATNNVSGLRGIIGTGVSNVVQGTNAGVFAGNLNSANGANSGVLAGQSNAAASTTSLGGILAGQSNQLVGTAARSGIVAGNANLITNANNNGILAGATNTIASSSTECAILCGTDNTIQTTAVSSAIIYGNLNTIITTQYSLVGGLSSQALGNHSIALGRQAVAQAVNSGVFIWQSSNAANFFSAANNEFAIKPLGGVRIFTNAASTTGMTMAAGGSSWVAVSSAKVKQEVGPIPTDKVLERLDKVSVKTFKYKKDRETEETFDDINVGTTAEEWNEAFGDLITPKMIQTVVENENGETIVEEIPGISQQDQIGILLLMVKELAKEVQTLKNKTK